MVSYSKNMFVFKFSQNDEKFTTNDFVQISLIILKLEPSWKYVLSLQYKRTKKDLRFQLDMKGSGSKSGIFVAAMIFFGVLHNDCIYDVSWLCKLVDDDRSSRGPRDQWDGKKIFRENSFWVVVK